MELPHATKCLLLDSFNCYLLAWIENLKRPFKLLRSLRTTRYQYVKTVKFASDQYKNQFDTVEQMETAVTNACNGVCIET